MNAHRYVPTQTSSKNNDTVAIGDGMLASAPEETMTGEGRLTPEHQSETPKRKKSIVKSLNRLALVDRLV